MKYGRFGRVGQQKNDHDVVDSRRLSSTRPVMLISRVGWGVDPEGERDPDGGPYALD